MDKNLRRGIDLQNRVWDSKLGKKFKGALHDGGPINKITFIGLIIVFSLNVFIVSTIFNKDVTPAFSSSAFLNTIASFLTIYGLSKANFFSFLSIVSFCFAPISFYLFVRRIVQRRELLAFLATLLFVIPNPIAPHGMSLVAALLNGDGAHAIVFSYIPLFLLYFKAFINKGLYAWGLISVLGSALTALISPFMFFNLLIFFVVITVSEGFLGGFRIKFTRLIFVLVFSTFLFFFWYHPETIYRILVLDSFRFTCYYLLGVLPLLIPIVPVIGAISFLIFDRRERLQPVFIGIFLLIIYLLLYRVSSNLNMTGVFMPERYLVELSFIKAFFSVLIIGFIIDVVDQKIKKNLNERHHFIYRMILFSLISLTVSFIFVVSVRNINLQRQENYSRSIVKNQTFGVGNVTRKGFITDIPSIMSSLVSLLTLTLLLYIIKLYPLSTVNKFKDLNKESINTST